MKAKSVMKSVLLLVGGPIATLAALAFGLIALFFLVLQPKHSKWQVIRAFTKHEAAFETVRQHIDDTDFSAYYSHPGDVPYIMIYRWEPLPDSMIYNEEIHAYRMQVVEIEDNAVNQAVDTLFRDADVKYIEQTSNKTLRSVYFEFSGGLNGVVYSRNGEAPTDTVSDMDYRYKRINEHWFYWKGTWDD